MYIFPNFIKIDVDGIEHLILEGGNQILKKTKSILVEIDDSFTLQVENTKKYSIILFYFNQLIHIMNVFSPLTP